MKYIYKSRFCNITENPVTPSIFEGDSVEFADATFEPMCQYPKIRNTDLRIQLGANDMYAAHCSLKIRSHNQSKSVICALV